MDGQKTGFKADSGYDSSGRDITLKDDNGGYLAYNRNGESSALWPTQKTRRTQLPNSFREWFYNQRQYCAELLFLTGQLILHIIGHNIEQIRLRKFGILNE